MRYLGIDYGKRWVGLAVADTAVDLVLPLETIENKGKEKLFEHLADYIKSERIDEVVVGVPFGMGGGATAQTKEVEAFIADLAGHIDKPIREEDERLTSQGAARLVVNGFGKETRSHSNAAAMILESFVERRKRV